MPPSTLTTAAMRGLIAFVRTFRENTEDAPARLSVTSDKGPLQGVVLTQSATGLALRDDDGRIHLLRRDGDEYRTVTSQADWPTYNGQPTGSRFSALTGIDTTNVGRLAPAWTFTLDGASRLEVTPVVVDGVMYVTTANECYALDAGSGRQLWHFKRPRTRGLSGDAAGGINRGVAVAGDRVFMVTDHAHIIALSRSTGAVLWDTAMADWRLNYGATSAPLAAGGLVISGTSGGDEGIRGFLAAFDQATGREVWRVWTVPRPGEPGSETWRGRDILHPCASAWLTGTYDAALETVYWPTGNPCPDYDGSQRVGDNLYSDSILALDLKSGRVKWHYQYTPHDLWDWDAQQTAALVDADWHGQPRHLLLHANRNGFFYVLDRTDGTLLLAKPFVKKLTWAREIGADGRPVLNPDQVPNRRGRQGVSVSGWRDQLVLDSVQPGDRPVLRAGARELQHLLAGTVYLEGGTVLLQRRRPARAWRTAAEGPQGHRHPDRRDQVGSAPGGPRVDLGRRAGHRRRRGDCGRRRWGVDGRGRERRAEAVAIRRQRTLEGVADDLRLRQPPVRRDCRRSDDHRVRDCVDASQRQAQLQLGPCRNVQSRAQA